MNNLELNNLSIDELKNKILETRKLQFNLRLKKASGDLKQTHLISQARRLIARIKTIMTKQVGCSDGK